ncbi:unnamed protein product [Adineta steineri]|uniref:Uncharacterized protein n=1 Tax=Adineta steineri TaxID=433720 RepID=A0A819TNJ0_9BILA|nr:unnamed protein product [Adineta steineri]CAF4067681.1 unnamed protein product [Adineta steineri]
MEVFVQSDQSVLHSQQLFDDYTTYRTDYVLHSQQERFHRKREEYIRNSSALYSLITDREDFISKDGMKKRQHFLPHFFSCLN